MGKNKKEITLLEAVGDKLLSTSDDIRKLAKHYGRSEREVSELFVTSLIIFLGQQNLLAV